MEECAESTGSCWRIGEKRRISGKAKQRIMDNKYRSAYNHGLEIEAQVQADAITIHFL